MVQFEKIMTKIHALQWPVHWSPTVPRKPNAETADLQDSKPGSNPRSMIPVLERTVSCMNDEVPTPSAAAKNNGERSTVIAHRGIEDETEDIRIGHETPSGDQNLSETEFQMGPNEGEFGHDEDTVEIDQLENSNNDSSAPARERALATIATVASESVLVTDSKQRWKWMWSIAFPILVILFLSCILLREDSYDELNDAIEETMEKENGIRSSTSYIFNKMKNIFKKSWTNPLQLALERQRYQSLQGILRDILVEFRYAKHS